MFYNQSRLRSTWSVFGSDAQNTTVKLDHWINVNLAIIDVEVDPKIGCPDTSLFSRKFTAFHGRLSKTSVDKQNGNFVIGKMQNPFSVFLTLTA